MQQVQDSHEHCETSSDQRSLKKLSTNIDNDIDDAAAEVKEEDSGYRKQSLTITERVQNWRIRRFRAHVES